MNEMKEFIAHIDETVAMLESIKKDVPMFTHVLPDHGEEIIASFFATREHVNEGLKKYYHIISRDFSKKHTPPDETDFTIEYLQKAWRWYVNYLQFTSNSNIRYRSLS